MLKLILEIKYKTNSFMVLSCFFVTLSSCYNNKIYFDIDKQSVISCNKEVITTLRIASDDQKDFYYFTKLPKAAGTNNFSLIEINRDYVLENIFKRINIDSFRLRPETEYSIRNSTFGDAISSELLIKTDNKGRVIYSSIKSCK